MAVLSVGPWSMKARDNVEENGDELAVRPAHFPTQIEPQRRGEAGHFGTVSRGDGKDVR